MHSWMEQERGANLYDAHLTEVDLPGRRNVGLEAGMRNTTKTQHEVPKGARERHQERIRKFVADGDPLPRLRHHAFWLLHNCVAHPVLGLTAKDPAIEFHELTSAWLNHVAPAVQRGPVMYRQFKATRPEIKNPLLWVLHNCVAHVAIGFVPSKATFAFHDWTAELMQVDGWV